MHQQVKQAAEKQEADIIEKIKEQQAAYFVEKVKPVPLRYSPHPRRGITKRPMAHVKAERRARNKVAREARVRNRA